MIGTSDVNSPLPPFPGTIAAIVLAAGSAKRMAGVNKLLSTFDRVPLVRRVAEAALCSSASPVLVVTGARKPDIVAALAGLDVEFVHNADYLSGMASSISAGVRHLLDCDKTSQRQGSAAGALILLADMPEISAGHLNRIIGAFNPDGGKTIVVPTSKGQRGNPVLWARCHFAALTGLTGDKGARHLIAPNIDAVAFVEIGEPAALDVDTQDAVLAAGGHLPVEKS